MKQVKVRRQIKIEAYPIYDLEDTDIGKEITIVDCNGEFFTGTYKEIVDDTIILQNPGDLIGLGLPLRAVLCFFYGKPEDTIKIRET